MSDFFAGIDKVPFLGPDSADPLAFRYLVLTSRYGRKLNYTDDSVAAAAEKFRAGHDRLDVLVNNAGLMALPHQRTVQGFEMQLGVNHLAAFALTGHLLDPILATPNARVATRSSAKCSLITITASQKFPR